MFKWVSIGIVAIAALWGIGSYNGLASGDQAVKQSYSQVQNVLQRQADLIPNLVETVERYAKHEAGTFTAVAEARSGMSTIAKMKPEELAKHPELLQEAAQLQQQALLNFKMVAEKYPELKANALFDKLFNSLEGSINRVTVERRTNQQTIQRFNTHISTFPGIMVARMGGFASYPYFEAEADAQKAPKVKFGNGG